ncbi:hypothetical protein U3516DRAFT_799271 [Neocallimastix sp. 'constans']
MEENLIIDINKCKSFIILNDKKEILKYDSSHNHPEKEYDISLPMMKHKIKDGIEKSSIHFVKLFKEYNDDIFVDGTFFIAPTYSYQIFITRTYAKELDINTCNNNIIIKPKKNLHSISNLPILNPEYIFDIYVIIKIISIKNNYCQFFKFLEYFYKTYLVGIWKIKKRAINKANEFSVLIERYKNIEAKLIESKCDRNNIINLWFDYLTNLNNII